MFEKMLEKNNFVLNCDVCDARRINEESLSGYEQIMINADMLLVDEHSRSILNRLPMVCNADETLDVEGEVSIISTNGNYEISGDTLFDKKTVITVNGNLSVRPGTEQVMENVVKITVNGSATYPESMAPFMGKLSVNGEVRCIPNGCIELKPVFVIDKYFPLRAKQDGKYYVSRKVVLTDPDVDLEALVSKNVHFVTKRFLVREELIEKSIVMFEENVEMDVVPTGYAYIGEETKLSGDLLRRYGSRLYIDGDLTLGAESESCFDQVEKLRVNGDVRLLERQREAFAKIDASYEKLVFVKGRYISNKPLIVVDEALLEASPDGVEIGNCAVLRVKKEVSPQLILERLLVGNCAQAFCSPEQRSALQMICGNVAKISDGEGKDSKEGDEEEDGGILGMLKKAANSKVVNADTYIL